MLIDGMFVYIIDLLEKIKWTRYYEHYRRKYTLDKTFRFNGEGITFYGDGKIIIGANSYIGRYSSIQSSKGCIVKIGENCSISHYFMVYTENRVPNQDFSKTQKRRKGNVTIGNYCWIGAFVFIREGITIGDNVVIGAHSVVTKDIPSFCMAAGVPAKIIKSIKR